MDVHRVNMQSLTLPSYRAAAASSFDEDLHVCSPVESQIYHLSGFVLRSTCLPRCLVLVVGAVWGPNLSWSLGRC